MKNTKHKNQNKQAGFTMVELLIVIAVMSILVALSAVYLFNSNPSDNFKLDKELLEGVPSTKIACDKYNPSSLVSCTDTLIPTLPNSYFENTTTVCGDTWSVTPSANQIVWTYPLDSCADNDVIGASYALKLSDMSKTSASYDSATDDLTITITR
jgi:prepilin-type N-terminal cleavage/methylation domain-containing protein